MADAERPGRPNQKSRTRKDLLRAAARLMQAGSSPTLEEVAEEAMVSRATAYRYFPGVEALLTEAALDVAMPDGESFFAGDALGRAARAAAPRRRRGRRDGPRQRAGAAGDADPQPAAGARRRPAVCRSARTGARR